MSPKKIPRKKFCKKKSPPVSENELLPKFFDLIFTKLDRDGDGDFDKSDLQKWMSQ